MLVVQGINQTVGFVKLKYLNGHVWYLLLADTLDLNARVSLGAKHFLKICCMSLGEAIFWHLKEATCM